MRCSQISNGVVLNASTRPKPAAVLNQLNFEPCGSRVLPFESQTVQQRRRRKSVKATCATEINENSIILSEPTSQLRGVIFDLDGVLCDSEEICRE